MNWLRRWSLSTFILTLAGFAVCGQTQQADKPPAVEKWLLDRSLTLTPRSEPRPALVYRLFPLVSERKPGNAVPIYLRLVHETNDATRRDWSETPLPWNKGPVSQVPLEEAKVFLDRCQRLLRQLELGARRATAEWNYTLDQGSVVDVLLPDAQVMRSYVPMMILKARVALAKGDYVAAAHWLETGFGFSQHVGNGPTLIHGLIGIACASQFADCLLDFVEQPDAPNLYWSLVALPRPFIDLRGSMEFEQRFLDLQFPDLTDLNRPRSPDEWDAALKRVRTEWHRIVGADRESGGKARLKAPEGTAPEDPASKSPDLSAARKCLAERRKLAAEKLKAMPPAQVLLLFLMDSYTESRDDFFKASYLPYREAKPLFDEAERHLKATPDTEGNRFSKALLPAIVKVKGAETRINRKIAALRVIEALRLHAALNDGQLPDKLSELKIVPVPDDPGTGKPFEYQRNGDSATLIGRIPDESLETTGLRYRLQMKKK